MTDKKILEEVYSKLEFAVGGDAVAIRRFIEQEWQKADDQELVGQYNRNREAKDHAIDVAGIERHRGLVLGEDGTVKELI